MISKQLGPWSFIVFHAVCAGGCGNYSNEDLDFQLALPEQGDIEAKMQLSVTRADSAEYYLATRNAIATFNSMVSNLTGFVDVIRGVTPTSRHGNQRAWGPFADDKHSGWETEVVMQRSTVSSSLLHMDYGVQVRPVGQGDSSWVPFLTGNYTSQGSASRGLGEIHLHVNDVRNGLYPVDDDPGLRDLDHIDVTYDNAAYPISVTMEIVNLSTATTRAGHYEYHQNQDGSGTMIFFWQGTTDTGVQVNANMTSQWLGSGAGRADLTADLTPNLPNQSTPLGTDCWGVDTMASYSYRLRNSLTNQPSTSGSVGSCLF
jgi:hypothetical protein